MKKKSYLFCLLLAAGVTFISCRNDDDPPPDPSVTDTGVLIGNIDDTPIRWATRNVAESGTFAPTPESVGRFFRWNCRIGMTVTTPETSVSIENWDNTAWSRVNDPCPQGWRVPTMAELTALRDAGYSDFTQLNGVYGRFFGTAPNHIFLPATGVLFVDGTVFYSGVFGVYWSSTQYNTSTYIPITLMGNLQFDNEIGSVVVFKPVYTLAFGVRCVAE